MYITVKYKHLVFTDVFRLHDNLITACLIKGQVRRECASHPGCHQTCNSTGPVACPAICIVNGCECPNGTVIDEDKMNV